MTFEEFQQSNGQNLSRPLLALWSDHQNDWEQAHTLAQDIEGREGAWIHAYLHRKEGDTFNAGYWYRRAGRPAAGGDLKREWEEIVRELLLSST